MDTYITGTSGNSIFVTADVNTAGLAHTRAAVRNSGGAIVSTKTSATATGDIHRGDMGKAEDCAGNLLVVATEVSLSILPTSEREAEFERLSATYCIEGGTEGQTNFPAPDQKVHSADFAVVILRKIVELR